MNLIVWGSFLAFVLAMIALDLGVFHRRAHVVKLPEALTWTFVWISLALAFNVLVYFLYAENWMGWDIDAYPLTGQEAALQFLTGYVVEKSLSVDNIFVIAMIFAYFRVQLELQHRVLFWGILGAIVLRGLMIGLGVALIVRFDWILFVFGTLLVFSAARLLIIRHDNLRPERNFLLRLARRLYPVTDDFVGTHFVVRRSSQLAVTPLALTLVLVESSDVMFAVDSIPAIFAISLIRRSPCRETIRMTRTCARVNSMPFRRHRALSFGSERNMPRMICENKNSILSVCAATFLFAPKLLTSPHSLCIPNI